MRPQTPLLAAFTLCVCACGGTEADNDPGADGHEPAAMDGMTAAHNQVRAAATPAPATPLNDLTWSAAIASTAQTYAGHCVFEHSGGQYGENLFAEYGEMSTPAQVVDAWAGEAANYHYATNTCDSGEVCGHYTQLVWAETARLGCGRATCHVNSPFPNGGAWILWVCNYDPPGNVVGQTPY
jgi:uncharacterized protein YkwD